MKLSEHLLDILMENIKAMPDDWRKVKKSEKNHIRELSNDYHLAKDLEKKYEH